MGSSLPELRAAFVSWSDQLRTAMEVVKGFAVAKVDEIISTPGASDALNRGKIGLADPDPVVRAEWEGIDQLAVPDWPRFAERRAIFERVQNRAREFQAGAAEANRESRVEAQNRRARHRRRADEMRKAEPTWSDVQISKAIFAELTDKARKGQSAETIRKNIRLAGKAL